MLRLEMPGDTWKHLETGSRFQGWDETEGLNFQQLHNVFRPSEESLKRMIYAALNATQGLTRCVPDSEVAV